MSSIKFYGETVSEYGVQKGYVDYLTLANVVGDRIPNNTIRDRTLNDWEIVAGEFEEMIFQDFIISESGYKFLKEHTNEIVFYNENLDIYVWGITHYGTNWDHVVTRISLATGELEIDREDEDLEESPKPIDPYVQEYLDLQKKHQEELSEFPIAYAFSDKQLQEALKELGATKEECCTYLGCGDVMRKVDVPKFKEMSRRHVDEIREAMQDEDFAESAFLYEMDNHEYAINWDGDDEVLAALCMDAELVREYGLEDAYQRARKSHMKHAQEWGVI